MSQNYVLLGLGANIGNPLRQIRESINRLQHELGPLTLSSVFQTEPVGFADQPWFLNMVVHAQSDLPPVRILEIVQDIEREMGRERREKNGPRVIDIDVLDVGGIRQASDDLWIPHPRMHLREFVLAPLAELWPGWKHPVLRRTASELLAGLELGPGVERMGLLEELT